MVLTEEFEGIEKQKEIALIQEALLCKHQDPYPTWWSPRCLPSIPSLPVMHMLFYQEVLSTSPIWADALNCFDH